MKIEEMERRQPKETDQEEVQKGFELVKQLMIKHPEIEATLWASVMWSILVNGYSSSGMSYIQFTNECNEIKQHYKPWFDK